MTQKRLLLPDESFEVQLSDTVSFSWNHVARKVCLRVNGKDQEYAIRPENYAVRIHHIGNKVHFMATTPPIHELDLVFWLHNFDRRMKAASLQDAYESRKEAVKNGLDDPLVIMDGESVESSTFVAVYCMLIGNVASPYKWAVKDSANPAVIGEKLL